MLLNISWLSWAALAVPLTSLFHTEAVLSPPDREINLSYLNRLEGLTCRFAFNSSSSYRCSFLDLV